MGKNSSCWKFKKQNQENIRSNNKQGSPFVSGKMENTTMVNLGINIAGQKKIKSALQAT